ncbi:glycoside hydrolase family 88/105 protein [Frigidibacter mobilis]|uniref:Di-trans,poly-cis-decaprenylcistransferase n=1 Tax=Frigidibacter mobilis TaxID=1335048 RepID=A0A159Z6T6_9RHOB|nr:glycoside hydrolase family 88 protein [Frigidibacter mobilis]AMY71087.1 di-trans,poly-cis-decaprenylcistransferase [Frigidibacter mobilis]
MPLLAYADAYARDYAPYKGGAWCYEDGCLYRGLVLLHQATGQVRWLDHLLRLTRPQITADGALAGYDPQEFNIDNILAGRCLFHLHRQTGDARYLVAAERLAAQLARHPRTAAGNYWHKAIYPDQVWLDGLYMGLPFQIEWGQQTGDTALVEDAVAQMLGALDLARMPSGLYAHGYDATRRQAWANPVTGQSPALWSRALGWLAMALADSCDLLGAEAPPALAAALADLLNRMEPLATANHLWLQVPDQPDLPGNYEESSASAMFAYAGLVAARLGIADRVGPATLDALQGRLQFDPKAGRHRLPGICAVAGLGGNGPRRDGTPAYYVSEPVVSDDPKGSGPLLMGAAEHHRAALQPAI